MAKKSAAPPDVPGLSVAPTFFADQPAALFVGAAVTKLARGGTDPGRSNSPRPVVTVVMPTHAIIELVNDLKSTFDEPSFKKEVADGLGKALKIIVGGGKSVDRSIEFRPKP